MPKEITYRIINTPTGAVHIEFSEPVQAVDFSPSQALIFSNLIRDQVKKL